MFGDEASGYVFSHTFSLKDTQSRGFQRWYFTYNYFTHFYSSAAVNFFLIKFGFKPELI